MYGVKNFFQKKIDARYDRALVRERYGPKKHPELYTDPQTAVAKLSRKRRTKKRSPLTRDEKLALSKSVELAEIELEDLKRDNARMKRECALAGPPLNAVLRSPKLKGMLSPEMLEEIEAFTERY